MTPRQPHQAKEAASGGRGGQPARRLMAALFAAIAIIVVCVLFAYGLRKPEDGPGNVPAEGTGQTLRDNGSPPTSK